MPYFNDMHFDVYCDCGWGLCERTAVNTPKHYGTHIVVEPCEQCLDVKWNEGYSAGYDQGAKEEQLNSDRRITELEQERDAANRTVERERAVLQQVAAEARLLREALEQVGERVRIELNDPGWFPWGVLDEASLTAAEVKRVRSMEIVADELRRDLVSRGLDDLDDLETYLIALEKVADEARSLLNWRGIHLEGSVPLKNALAELEGRDAAL